jgi:methyl-accepting chemotaxis protein
MPEDPRAVQLSVKQSIFLFLSIMFLFLVGTAGKQYLVLGDLAALQDAGAEASSQAISYTKASSVGSELYQVIADGVINRNLAETAKEWTEVKAAAAASINDIASQVKDPKETGLVKEAAESFSRIVDIFEKEMMPELKKSAELTPAIQAIDGRLDDHLRIITKNFLTLKDVRIATAKQGDRDFDSTIQNTLRIVAGLLLVSFIFALGSAVYLVRKVTSPLTRMADVMRRLAEGDQSTPIPFADKADEIGVMAGAVRIFRDRMVEAGELQAARVRDEGLEAERGKKRMMGLADDFETAVGGIVDTVSATASDLEASASTLNSTAIRVGEISTTVAAASEEATSNVQSVASATEELSSSVNEISRQVQESARIADDAVGQARTTNDRVSELSKASAHIGNVVELINSIAGQTNLLALNATIEAARAGEAGRGFAVVAAEVKTLAEQTAKATGEIGHQIANIQAATKEAVDAIQQISGTIERLSGISSSVAAAVEQQGAATLEISRNIQRAADGAQQVSANIVDVQNGARDTGSASSHVLSAAQSLARNGDSLKDQLARFLGTLRAA